MRIVRFEYKQEILYGVLRGDEISIIAGQPFGEIQTSGRTIGLSEVTLLAPVAPPNSASITADTPQRPQWRSLTTRCCS